MQTYDNVRTKVLLTRFGGHWHAKAMAEPSLEVTLDILEHMRKCLHPWNGRKNIFYDGCFESYLKHDVPIEQSETKNITRSKKRATKKFTRRSNKSKKRPQPKYKRPRRPEGPALAHEMACRKTSPRPGPLSQRKRLRILQNRMELPKGMEPLTKSELLRISLPAMGL